MKKFNPACIKTLIIVLFIQSLALHSTAQCAGNAIQFDGVNDYINVGPQQSLEVSEQLTIEAWIYPIGNGTGPEGSGIIVNKEGEYEIARFGDGTIRFALDNSSPGWTWVNSSFVAPLNKWSHIVVTYSANNQLMKFYGNGSEVFSGSASGLITDYHSQDDFRIGGRQHESQYFKGKIEEVRVWNKALSATTIKKWYKKSLQNSHPNINNLIGYWKLDEGSGTTTADESANANNGTLTNGAAWVASNAPVNKLISKIRADTLNLCANDSSILTATKGIDYTYQWKKGNKIIAGATKRKYVTKSPGNYKVIITNSCGESKESEAVKVTNTCLTVNAANGYSIASKTSSSGIKVYPNPASDKTTISFTAAIQENTIIKIFNSQGQAVITKYFSSVKGLNTCKLSLDKLPAGIYHIELTYTDRKEYQQLQIIK
ncbi:MAG TPA: LamG-like jellyroll fold domain-containing protein [Parafilimonas sp.]|nr:LamG-like jellyroll fold domain-containing protein [Parafilimonas sp.]